MAEFEAKMQLAELEGMRDLFQKITDLCFTRCIRGNYSKPELSRPESICVDECVIKFMNIHQQIGPILNEMAEEQARL